MAPQMSSAESNMSSNTICRSSRGANYNKEALHQIRASLQPYAHGGPRERLSPNLASAACQPTPAQHGGGYRLEDDFQRGFSSYSKAPPPPVFPVDGSKVIRKSSFEKEPLVLSHRGSPALDSNASTRSDSPGMHYPCALPLDSSMQCPGARSYAYGCTPDTPPPPPPPRSQGMAPPPTPPRGTTPPPIYSTSSGVAPRPPPLLLSRLSPGPSKTKAPPANYVNVSSVSQGASQRGTSPVSHVCRQPLVVQSCPQVQHQMQALALNSNSPAAHAYSPQGDRPPPYPLAPPMKPVAPPAPGAAPATKINTWPSSYNAALQSRQSPQLTYQGGMGTPVPPASASPNLPMPPPPIVRGGQTARQAKTPTPIIMQSVKSTQVQKPVLQTAVAPASPAVPTSPPSYASSIQQKQAQGVPMAPEASTAASSPTTISTPVPTTDPPSYHSTMQAMAAARGFNYMPQPVAAIPVQDVPVQELDLSSTPLAQIPISQVTTVDSIITTQPVSQVETVSSCHDLSDVGGQGSKFSPISADTASIASRSESPGSSSVASQSPVSCLSAITSTPSTQSDMTQESGYSSSQSARSMPPPLPPPPAPPPVEKTMHQSPIPERKNISSELEEQRRESKVKVYSPEAYKFFMEQHVENVIKFQDQRNQRKIQLEKEMKKIGLSSKDQLEIRRMLIQKESNYIRLKRAKMNKLMFNRIKLIGVGAFGEVALVRKLDTNRLYAMKTLRKADVLKRNQVAHVKAERDILAEADNEWVVKLYYSFQDKDNLYLIMDYIPGGDLMSLLMKFGIFEDSLARFYIGELVCAVESVHKMGFIHRDIKPDNILIDQDGHIKLTDFGLCTGFRWTHNSKYYQTQGEHGRQDSIDPCGDNDIVCRCNDLKPLERRRRRQHLRCLAHSLVGTPNYIAPEVLARSGYTQLCDWWSVGVILYEMLVGQPPFMASTPAETQYKVIHWETSLSIPKQADLSPEAKDLILSLCTHPESRLGRNGAQDVKQHPYFGDLNFEAGLRKQPALYIPKINHPADTSNFDPVDPDRLRPSETNDSEVEWINNSNQPVHAFFEFTFRRFFDSTPGSTGPESDRDNQHPVYV